MCVSASILILLLCHKNDKILTQTRSFWAVFWVRIPLSWVPINISVFMKGSVNIIEYDQWAIQLKRDVFVKKIHLQKVFLKILTSSGDNKPGLSLNIRINSSNWVARFGQHKFERQKFTLQKYGRKLSLILGLLH